MKNSHRLLWLWVSVTVFGLGCSKEDQIVDPPKDYCSGKLLKSIDWTVLHAGQTWTTASGTGELDCTTLYYFYFRWADLAKRTIDNDPPPIDNIAGMFDPAGPAGFTPEASQFGGNPPGYSGGGWWLITFAPTPSQIDGNKGPFTIHAKLSSSAADIDSTEIYTMISYREPVQ